MVVQRLARALNLLTLPYYTLIYQLPSINCLDIEGYIEVLFGWVNISAQLISLMHGRSMHDTCQETVTVAIKGLDGLQL